MRKLSSFGVAQALVLGLCVGLVASSVSCGPPKPAPARCNRNTCDGCCDENGQCFGKSDAGLQSNEACGLGGVTCQVCSSNQTCVDGNCRIGGMGGGSGGAGGSMGGGTGGTGGGSSMLSDGGVCNATTCPTGCCNASGCVMPAQQNFTRCGSGGAACAGCPNGQACAARPDGGTGNVCQVPNCTACLDTSGNCRTDKNTLTDDNFCGGPGGNTSVCARCDTANGQRCMNGRCVGMSNQCNAMNCDGCCSGNTCISADAGQLSNAQCGLGGQACATCSSPATCDKATGMCMGGGAGGGGGGFPGLDGGFGTVCDPTTCAGCCDFLNGCLTNGAAYPPPGGGLGQACGTGGGVCKICLPDCATGMALGLCF